MTTDEVQGERRTWWHQACDPAQTATDRRNQRRFLVWLFAWMVAFLAATWLLRSDAALSGPTAWSVAIAPDLLGLAALAAFVRFLRQADELTRKIQLEALAIGFGAAVLFGVSYQLLERAGAPALDVSDLIVVLMVGWAAGQLVARSRYR